MNISNATVACTPLIEISTFMHFCLIPAVGIIGLLAFLQRRDVKCCCFSWRPGMVVPADFLNGYKHRWAYAAAFGTTSNRILVLILNSDQYWENDAEFPTWAKKTLLLLLATMETCFVFYPIFACLTTPYKLVAACLGVCYSLAWFIIQTIYMFDCPYEIYSDSFIILDSPYSKLLYQWPAAVFSFVLVVYFLRMLWRCFQSGDYIVKEKPSLALQHHIVYVKSLLKGQLPKSIVNAFDEGFIECFKYRSIPGFVYPSRFWSVLFVSLSIAYQIVIAVIYMAGQLASALGNWTPVLVGGFEDTFKDLFVIFTVCLWVSAGLLIILLIGSLFFIFKNYRRNFLQLCRGDKSFVPSALYMSPANLMVTSMRWGGYQIAYLAWGLFIFFSTVFILLEAVISFIYVIIYIYGWDAVLLYAALLFGPPVLMSIIIFYGQLFLAWRFFLQPRPTPDQPVPLAINNRKVFETVYYLTFFMNITIGLFSSLLRVLLSLIVGLLTLGRMDQAIVKRGYERFDKGHGAYIGMLFVDYTHNHPVLRVFCEELRAAVDKSRATTQEELVYVNSVVTHNRAKPILGVKERRLWYLAYTLIRNPGLIQHRKHNLEWKKYSLEGFSDIMEADSDNINLTDIKLEENRGNTHVTLNNNGEKNILW